MNKHIKWAVVLGASCIFQIYANPSLALKNNRQGIDTWVATYYKPLSRHGKEILISAGRENLKILESCKKSLSHEGGMQLLSKEAELMLFKLWTQSTPLIKEQAALEVLDVVCAFNALNQLRLDWLKKVVAQYQQYEPNIFERILVRLSQKGQHKLYRELHTLIQWSNEIVDQLIIFENEMLRLKMSY